MGSLAKGGRGIFVSEYYIIRRERMNKKVFISTTTFAEFDKAPLKLLEEKGYQWSHNPHKRKMTSEEIFVSAKEAVGIVAGTETLGADVLKNLANLKVISRCGSGMDNVDIGAAEKKGIKVCNTPDGPTLAVAELTIGLILNLLRRVNEMDTALRAGKWTKITGNLLTGKKVGIVGFGRIGRKVANLLNALGAEPMYYDVEEKKDVYKWCKKCDLDELLKESDILSLHLSFSGKSNAFIGGKELKLMTPGSLLINVSRGGAVDEEALYDSLKKGHLAGAALDVFKEEPYSGRLRELKNVILTPHIGSYAKEARVKMEVDAVKNLLVALGEK